MFCNVQDAIVFILARNRKLVLKYQAYSALQWYWKHIANRLAENLQHHSFNFLSRDKKLAYWGVCLNEQYASYPRWKKNSIKSIKKLNSNWINLDPVSITVEMVHTSLQILAAEDLATLRQIARWNSVYVIRPILPGFYNNTGRCHCVAITHKGGWPSKVHSIC